jgi:hypothetical protein
LVFFRDFNVFGVFGMDCCRPYDWEPFERAEPRAFLPAPAPSRVDNMRLISATSASGRHGFVTNASQPA